MQAIREWLKNWKSKVKREQSRKWVPPAPPGPPRRKPRATTAFEAFSKSPNAPQGGDYLTTDGRRCDVQALQAARKAEWAKLSIEAQEQYREAAAAVDKEKAEGRSMVGTHTRMIRESQSRKFPAGAPSKDLH